MTFPYGGYVTLHETRRVEDGKLILGGFRREYDHKSQLVRETEPADYVILHGYCDAPKQQSAKKRGFLSRLMLQCGAGSVPG